MVSKSPVKLLPDRIHLFEVERAGGCAPSNGIVPLDCRDDGPPRTMRRRRKLRVAGGDDCSGASRRRAGASAAQLPHRPPAPIARCSGSSTLAPEPARTGPSAASLPARVRERIRVQEERSEILVGVAQLAFIVFMAVLYAISPKKFGAEAPFAPVPWVLSAYALFTLVRLALAYARRLPHGFVYLSIVVDVALLMGLIFSFHLQYEQPPSFVPQVARRSCGCSC